MGNFNYFYLRYKFAILDPCILADSMVRFAFEMKEGNFSWCAVGMCYKNIILNNNYGFPYSYPGHGAYMISSNAGTWSTLEADRNNLVMAFRFTRNDTVICTYDPNEKKIFFENKRTKEKYNLKFEIIEKDPLHVYFFIDFIALCSFPLFWRLYLIY